MLGALHTVSDLAARAAAIAERLRGDSAVVSELESVVRRAAAGSGPDRDVLIAFVRARVTHEDLPIDALRARAVEQGLAAAESVLRSDRAHRALARIGRLPEPLVPARAVFGLRYQPVFTRQGWRVRSALTRERLLRDPRAVVIGQLLELQGTTLADVLRLASRRPSTPEIVSTIASSPWLGQLSVREALVRNPFTDTWLALAMLPTVRRSVLVAASLDPELTRVARTLRM